MAKKPSCNSLEAERLPPRKPDWENVAPKILGRDWSDLRDVWLSNVPATNTAAIPRPEPAESLISLRQAISPYAADKFNVVHRDIYDDIQGLRAATLLDSIFMMLKSAHVLSAAQVHVDRGMCTWSLSSAYHAAYFAMKAVAGFLGVSIAEIDSNNYVLDVTTIGDQKPTSKNRTPRILVRAMKIQRVEHRQMWGLFLRLLRIAVIPEDILPPTVREQLLELSPTNFASQRNDLHYGNTSWLLDDLLACVVRPTFGVDPKLRTGEALDVERDDFSVVLGIVLVRLGFQLLADLGRLSNAFDAELQRVEAWLSNDQNALYQQVVGGAA